MEYNLETLENGCKKYNIMLTDKQREQFIDYYNLLIEWNKKINLTAITEFEEVLVKHFLDSISISKILDLNEVNNLIDVGTGAGFPGIPLKIIYPHIHITLLDSLNKRVNFLNTVVYKLGLENVEMLHGRAEEYAKKEEYREAYDLCVSRAVANLAVLAEYCLPYVKPSGMFIPYKSGKIKEELKESKKAIHILGGKLEDTHMFTLGNDMSRSLVLIRKIQSTPKKYPRKAGLPAKEPLK